MKLPFLDRKRELARLRAALAGPSSSLSVVYGRRRLGKSRLLQEAVRGRSAVYYLGDWRTAPLQRGSLAREMARFGITANTVCPGPTDTPLIAGMAERMEGGERLVESLTRAIPMRRLALPSDVAAAVAYFTSDAASYVTGQTLSVSGGLTMA